SNDWSADLQKLYGGIRQKARLAERKTDSTRVMNTKPSLPLTAYVGAYTNPLYGKADVTLRDGKLYFSLNNVMTGSLDHWHYDTFRLTYDQFWNGKDPVSFILDAKGKVAKLNNSGLELTKVPDNSSKGVQGGE
ncbi:MAG: DUF3471 domain-containing protein, partial [Cytophagaceae bacterium]